MKDNQTLQDKKYTKPKQRTRSFFWAILGIVIVLPVVCGLISIKVFQFKTMGDAAARQVLPPQAVNAVQVREENWQPYFSSVGTVKAVQGTIVRAEAEGAVRKIPFTAGAFVKTGDVLLQLDVDIEQAQLKEAEANAQWAESEFNRAKGLIGNQVISKADFESKDNTLKQALARVDNLRAVIAKKTVRAPFDGKLGIRQISVGQFLPKGSPVVSLYALDPVYIDYSLPQQKLGNLKEGLKVVVSSDAYKGRSFEGKITAVNPQIDTATRNVRIQATLADTGGDLRPGMFVTVDTFLDQSQKVLLIPNTAVLHAPFGNSVFVIEPAEAQKPDNAKALVIRQQFVRLGQRRGDFVAAVEGVKSGETIVAAGTFKLRPGMPVVIDNTLAPEFKQAPTPDNT